jgi:hypothetical protein
MARPKTFTHIVRRSPRDRRADTLTLHTTEGANRPGVSDLEGLANFFEGVQADATWGVDAEGNKCRMKEDGDSAWTNGFHDWNHRAFTIEQVGFAATKKRDWVRGYHNGLRTVAGIAADYKQRGFIKLKACGDSPGGINQHVDISGPGGHTDCGPGYPQRYVTMWARWVYHRRLGHTVRAAPYGAFVRGVQLRHGLKPNLNWR